MKILLFSRKHLLAITFVFLTCIAVIMMFRLYPRSSAEKMVMGGKLYSQIVDKDQTPIATKAETSTYFRPSSLPALNERFNYSFFDPYADKKLSDISLPKELLKSPEDTIVNYYSVLREAANISENKYSGCGTIGNAQMPYPVAYQFLSADYQKRLDYDQFLKSFLNILHTSLIKYKIVPVYDSPADQLRYFVEIETIQGSENGVSNFVYYYAFLDIVKEDGVYKIDDINYTGEDFLCAPYHGWSHDAESSVKIRYGEWCNMIKKMYPIKQKDYIKQVSFQGTDGNDYLILFYQLTNNTDVEIAQYMKDKNKKWKLTKLDPEKCLEQKKSTIAPSIETKQ